MIKKIASLKGHIDCPFCLSYLEWNDINDIQVFNGNKYVVCPECGKNVSLNDKKDYWDTSGGVLPDISEEDEGKILKVVDGKWSKVEGGSEEEETEKVIYEGGITTAINPESPEEPARSDIITDYDPIQTNSVYITFNGTTYELEKTHQQTGTVENGQISKQYVYGINIQDTSVLDTFGLVSSVLIENDEIINSAFIIVTQQSGTYQLKVSVPIEETTPSTPSVEINIAEIRIQSLVTSDCPCAIPIFDEENNLITTFYNIIGMSSNNVLQVPIISTTTGTRGYIVRNHTGDSAVNIYVKDTTTNQEDEVLTHKFIRLEDNIYRLYINNSLPENKIITINYGEYPSPQ